VQKSCWQSLQKKQLDGFKFGMPYKKFKAGNLAPMVVVMLPEAKPCSIAQHLNGQRGARF